MIIILGKKEFTLPDFFIVGAAKSGTTALVHYIEQHPNIIIPVKEPGYFCSSKINTAEIKVDLKNKIFTLKDYLQLYRNVGSEKIIGDASTRYLYLYRITIPKIKKVYKKQSNFLKIIIILRNPVDRAFSHYIFNIMRGLETLTFEEALNPDIIKVREPLHHSFNYINSGRYYEQVKAYQRSFPKTRLYLFEDLNNPDRFVQEIFKFLGVNHEFQINQNIFTNPSGIPKNRTLVRFLRSRNPIGTFIKKLTPQKYRPELSRMRYNLLKLLLDKPKMNENTRQYLTAVYRDEILHLQELIGQDLGHWINEG